MFVLFISIVCYIPQLSKIIDYCLTRTPRKLGKQNAVIQIRKGEVWYRVRTPETFHFDISGVVIAQGVLPHKNSPTRPSKMSKGWNNSQQVISLWTSSVKGENLKQHQSLGRKSLPSKDNVCWIHHLAWVGSSGGSILSIKDDRGWSMK